MFLLAHSWHRICLGVAPPLRGRVSTSRNACTAALWLWKRARRGKSCIAVITWPRTSHCKCCSRRGSHSAKQHATAEAWVGGSPEVDAALHGSRSEVGKGHTETAEPVTEKIAAAGAAAASGMMKGCPSCVCAPNALMLSSEACSARSQYEEHAIRRYTKPEVTSAAGCRELEARGSTAACSGG